MNAKTKMVSFRLSADEYVRFRNACPVIGARNVSELARAALHRIIASPDGTPAAIDEQVRGLRAKLDSLADEVDRISRTLAATNGARTH